MTAYVVGFAFTPDRSSVAMVRKNRPKWQAGKLNGIGGHIEAGETPLTAMRREFWEETGVDIEDWDHYLVCHYPGVELHFFRAFTPLVSSVRTTTDETIEIVSVPLDEVVETIPNLRWHLPMALVEPVSSSPIVMRFGEDRG